MKLAGEALEALRRADWQRLRREDPGRARFIKGTRFLLRRRADGLSESQRDLIEGLAETNARVYRGWLYLDQLRAIYRVSDPQEAALMLEDWCESAWRSELPEFRKVARTFTDHAEAIVNAIHLGIRQRAHRGHELHRAPDEPPLPGLSQGRVAPGVDSACVREDPGRAAHVNARRGRKLTPLCRLKSDPPRPPGRDAHRAKRRGPATGPEGPFGGVSQVAGRRGNG